MAQVYGNHSRLGLKAEELLDAAANRRSSPDAALSKTEEEER